MDKINEKAMEIYYKLKEDGFSRFDILGVSSDLNDMSSNGKKEYIGVVTLGGQVDSKYYKVLAEDLESAEEIISEYFNHKGLYFKSIEVIDNDGIEIIEYNS